MTPTQRIIQIKKDLINKLDGEDFKKGREMDIDDYTNYRLTLVSREVAAIAQYLDEQHEKEQNQHG